MSEIKTERREKKYKKRKMLAKHELKTMPYYPDSTKGDSLKKMTYVTKGQPNWKEALIKLRTKKAVKYKK